MPILEKEIFKLIASLVWSISHYYFFRDVGLATLIFVMGMTYFELVLFHRKKKDEIIKFD